MQKFFFALLLGLVWNLQTGLAQPRDKPNIIFLFADDLGWGDLGCYGNTTIKTPNLDKLAGQGILFTQFYVSGSVCSPSRAAIMTGKYPARLAIHGHFADDNREMNKKRDMPDYLNPQEVTLTSLLKSNGYATGHFGKWHLGSGEGAPMPGAYGIDFHKTVSSNDPAGKGDFDIWAAKNRPVSTKLVVDETVNFLNNWNKKKPFYLNIWLADPHATLNPSEEQMEPYRGTGPGKSIAHRGATEMYYATVTEMDKQLGRLLEYLQTQGLTENTLIIFSSDNGPEDIHIGNASHTGVGNTGPFRGRKRSLYEGGVRVPFLVSWPGHTPAGKVDTTSVIAGVDFIPTLCRITGTNIPANLQLDGEDRSAAFRGTPTARTQPLLWEWRFRVFGEPFHRSPMLSIRQGNWKLLLNPDRSRVELYNIPRDPGEMNNLAAQHPDVVQELSAKALAWQQTLPKGMVEPEAGKNAYPWPQGK